MAEGRRRLLVNLPLPEPVLVATSVAVVWDLARGSRCRTPRPWRAVAGVLVAAGAAVVAWSWDAAGAVVLDRPERVVVQGPYAVSRNPMYEGWLLVQAGLAIWCGSRVGLLGVPLAAGVLHGEVRREEDRLLLAFGERYRTYLECVPRYGLLRVPGG